MLSIRIACTCMLAVSALGQEADTTTDLPEPAPWKVFWKDGLRAESADGDFWFQIGGRIHQDWGTFGSTRLVTPDGDPLEDGVIFRRARLQFDGLVHGTVRFRAHYEFAGARVSFRDLWAEWTEVPLRIGYFREPMGLEANTSSNALTFLERSVASIALTPGRNSGVMYRSHFAEKRAQLAIGAFRATDMAGAAGGGDGSLTARLTWLPYMEEHDSRLMHVGLAASHRETRDEGVPISARLEGFTAGPVVDAVLVADQAHSAAAEFAWVSGPLSFQGELLGLDTDGSGSDDARLWGTYAQMSWFVTGEHRPYNHSRHAFGPVKPDRNFSRAGSGNGAWELAARWSRADLTDLMADGTTLENVTFGTNWYLNPSTRIMFNWIHSTGEGIDGDEDQFYMRFQLTF
ncbi:MAG: phosphate-selective porin OprO/OprP [Chlamydiales bacterium]|jgi:phosphate-selective porin OprO/OprP